MSDFEYILFGYALIGLVVLSCVVIVLREKWKEKHWHDTGKETSMETDYSGSGALYGRAEGEPITRKHKPK